MLQYGQTTQFMEKVLDTEISTMADLLSGSCTVYSVQFEIE